MSTFPVEGLKWVGKDNGGVGGNPDILDDPNIKEANSQSFVIGDLVYCNAGAVTEWADHATTEIAGIALTNATNVTSGNVPIKILKIHADDIFEATMDTAVTAASQFAVQYGLDTPSAGVWTVDQTDTTGPRVKVVGFKYGPAHDTSGNSCVMAMGDTDGRVYIKFLANSAGGTNLLQFDS